MSAGLILPAPRPGWMIAALALSDAAALLVAVGIGVSGKALAAGPVDFGGYLRLLPFLAVFSLTYAALGLYSDVPVSTPEELRRTTISSIVVFLSLAAITTGMRGGRPVTGTLLLATSLAVLLVPLFRAMTRRYLSRKSWWGYPAVIFGGGEATRRVVEALRRDPEFGLKPGVVAADGGATGELGGVPVHPASQVATLLRERGAKAYAVMVMPDAPHRTLQEIVSRHGDVFSHVLVMPELIYGCSHFAKSKSIGGRWGLELRPRELDSGHIQVKRCLDVALVLASAVLVAPLSLCVALAVKLTSRGPALFGQRRIGRGGREFVAWKFRTMRVDGDRILERHLAENPAAREEWESVRKLRNDPRLTGTGAFLRRSSLDELPQLWNVLKGEMSLVGPRPIVSAEVPRYGEAFDYYRQMPAGLTGLWQVSGRNDTTYEERVAYDVFYARNWSVWLDLHILTRTIGAVLSKSGAY
jgi:Undecaprenyl-phosphate galactose phosphotransferase WbaP